MKCQKCGQELPDDAIFCLKCGTPVEKPIGIQGEYYLKLSWTDQPMIMVTTNDDKFGNIILEQWKQKARLPRLVDTRTKDGVMYLWYFPEKLLDIFRMKSHRQDIMDMYQNLKEFALVNGWSFTGQEKTEKTGQDDLLALDVEFAR